MWLAMLSLLRKSRLCLVLKFRRIPDHHFVTGGKLLTRKDRPFRERRFHFPVSFHSEVSTHEDSHTWCSVVSDSNGDYSLELPTPWVSGVFVEANGFQGYERWKETNPLSGFPPGEYNPILNATPQASSATESPRPGPSPTPNLVNAGLDKYRVQVLERRLRQYAPRSRSQFSHYSEA